MIMNDPISDRFEKVLCDFVSKLESFDIGIKEEVHRLIGLSPKIRKILHELDDAINDCIAETLLLKLILFKERVL